MKGRVVGTSLVLVLALLPRPALAQSEFVKDNLGRLIRKIGFHASTSFADPVGTDKVQRDGSYGVSVGLAPGKTNGWRYPFGIAWFTEELVAPSGQVFGQLRARPIYGGIGYGWHFGKFSTGVQLQAGWSFNSMKANDELSQAFGYSPTEVAIDIGNAFAVRPQFKVEYFLTEKFTVRSSLNYVFTNPRVTISTPNGVTTQRWNASNVSLAIGVGFYPFRK